MSGRTIVVIGGGSTYTPELLGGLIEHAEELGVGRFVLHDIREDRLGPVAGFCQRMAARRGAPFAVERTRELDEALQGAHFVILQLRVGGQEARHEDIRMGLRHGLIGQETTGVGGMAKALRTIPVVLGIAQKVRERVPGAWLINFTNPSGIVTEALHRHGGVPVVGLCNIPMDTRMELADALGVDAERVELDYVGLNHLSWVRRVLVDGVDRLPEVLRILAAGGGPKNVPEMDYGPRFLPALGALPSPYLRYFYATDEMLAQIRGAPRTRAQEVMALEEQMLAYYADETNDSPPAALSERGGAWYSRAAVDVMRALLRDEPSVHIVNIASRGAVSGLPADSVVEGPAELSRAGVRLLAVGELAPEMRGLVHQVKAYEELTVEAATTGSRERALLALIAHPLVPTVRVAEAVLDDMEGRGLFSGLPDKEL